MFFGSPLFSSSGFFRNLIIGELLLFMATENVSLCARIVDTGYVRQYPTKKLGDA